MFKLNEIKRRSSRNVKRSRLNSSERRASNYYDDDEPSFSSFSYANYDLATTINAQTAITKTISNSGRTLVSSTSSSSSSSSSSSYFDMPCSDSILSVLKRGRDDETEERNCENFASSVVYLGNGPLPVAPMLAKPLKSKEELRKLLNKCKNIGNRLSVEEKYDGERVICVVSRRNGDPLSREIDRTYYSRTLKLIDFSTSSAFVPISLANDATSCVVDGERVYVDRASGRIVSVCETGVNRKSCLDQQYRVFDIQSLNGRSLLNLPFSERRGILENENFIVFSDSARLSDLTWSLDENLILDAFDRVVGDERGEGLMLKDSNSRYESDRRSSWWKLKALHIEGLKEEHTLYARRIFRDKNDLIGALECGYYVNIDDNDDRRTLSSSTGGKFVEVCRVSSGLNEEARNFLTLLSCASSKKNIDAENGETLSTPLIVDLVADKCTSKSLRHPIFKRFRLDLKGLEEDSLKKFIKVERRLDEEETPSNRRREKYIE